METAPLTRETWTEPAGDPPQESRGLRGQLTGQAPGLRCCHWGSVSLRHTEAGTCPGLHTCLHQEDAGPGRVGPSQPWHGHASLQEQTQNGILSKCQRVTRRAAAPEHSDCILTDGPATGHHCTGAPCLQGEDGWPPPMSRQTPLNQGAQSQTEETKLCWGETSLCVPAGTVCTRNPVIPLPATCP